MGRVQSGRGPRALDDKGDMVDQDYQDGYEAGARGARRELGALRAEVDRLATLCDVETDRACDEGIAATKWRGECDRLRAEVADSNETKALFHDKWLEAEAAIARVREACEAHRHGLMSPCAVDIVLEALDGGSE